jgi:hypothetical protein
MGGRFYNGSLQEHRQTWWRHKVPNYEEAAATRGRPLPSFARSGDFGRLPETIQFRRKQL